MSSKSDIKIGMTVRSSDGEKLGKITFCGEDEFAIEKGIFFHKEYRVPYHEVRDVRGDDIFLVRDRDSLHVPVESDTGEILEGERAQVAASQAGSTTSTAGEAARFTVAEEEARAVKHREQVGEVTVHKDVVTETQTISVPVEREEVTVTSRPATTTTAPADVELKEETVTVPVYTEQVEVQKRPVVREEVRVAKEAIEEEEEIEATVRRERVDVERSGDVHHRGATDPRGKDKP
jgi:uncharacterized protein (TIGR02271 family)